MAYGTRQGHTKIITDRIAAALRAAGHDVDLCNLRDTVTPPIADAYDAVLVGASVHAGGYEREVRQWVKDNVDALRTRTNAFYSVSLSAAGHDAESEADTKAVIEKFVRETGWMPARVEPIAGALAYSKYNWFIRHVMRRIVRKKEGGRFQDMSRDYDLTDYQQVDAFAGAMIAVLSAAAMHAR
jgi:menaquinone-dependent protoporphyrinogen oxidase